MFSVYVAPGASLLGLRCSVLPRVGLKARAQPQSSGFCARGIGLMVVTRVGRVGVTVDPWHLEQAPGVAGSVKCLQCCWPMGSPV